jgi:hypothetical protein
LWHLSNDAAIGISFPDTPFLKVTLPGAEPKRSGPEELTAKEKRLAREKTEFDNRPADLRLGIRACHAFDCPQLRILRDGFTGRLELETRSRLEQSVKCVLILRIPAKANADSEGNPNGIPCRRRTVLCAGSVRLRQGKPSFLRSARRGPGER